MNSLRIKPRALVIGLALLCLSMPLFSSSRTSASASMAEPVANVAQNKQLDFTLVNQTGYSIKELYIGPSNNPEWTEDMEILHGKVFRSGTQIPILFNPKAQAKKWDIMVVWSDGSGKVQWLGLDLTTIEKVTLLYDAENDKTSARFN
ncbi:MAG TPA: hypothetical protein VNI02_00465 [Blastocatellia bacterium]|jgi:hypothetical protein|nr:hypothetical protein [Blastocatellia bacterium]